jgi:hypothetical protein
MLFIGKKTDAEVWAGDSYRPSVLTTEVELAAGQRRVCGSLECTGGWTAPWRSRKRPIFEEQWGCSGRCVLAMVRAAIRRETGDGGVSTPASHRHRVPLGLVLLAQGWITHPQLQQALAAQRERGGRIGERLVEDCGLQREQITRGLSMQWSCPVLGTSGFSAQAMALVAPRVLVGEFGFLPLRVAAGKILYVGFEDRLDASAALALEQITELKVESGLVRTEEYAAARRSLLECDGIPAKTERVAETDALAARITAVLEQKQPVASKVVRVHQYYWLRMWLESGAKSGSGALPRDREDLLDYVFTVGNRA